MDRLCPLHFSTKSSKPSVFCPQSAFDKPLGLDTSLRSYSTGALAQCSTSRRFPPTRTSHLGLVGGYLSSHFGMGQMSSADARSKGQTVLYSPSWIWTMIPAPRIFWWVVGSNLIPFQGMMS